MTPLLNRIECPHDPQQDASRCLARRHIARERPRRNAVRHIHRAGAGLGLAAGVAYYVTKADAPYAAQRPRARNRARSGARCRQAGRSDTAAADKPRFDFYKILPGGEEPKVQAERKAPPDRAVVDQAKARKKTGKRTRRRKKARTAEPCREGREPARQGRQGRRPLLAAGGSFASERTPRTSRRNWRSPGGRPPCSGHVAGQGRALSGAPGPYDNTDELNRIKAELGKEGIRRRGDQVLTVRRGRRRGTRGRPTRPNDRLTAFNRHAAFVARITGASMSNEVAAISEARFRLF